MLLREIFYYAIARGGPGVLAFCAIIVFSRLLGPEEYGKYIVFLSYVTLCTSIFFQWLKSILLRFYSEELGDSITQFIFEYFLKISLGVFIAVFSLTFLWFQLSWYYAALLGFLIILQSFYDINLELFRAQGNPKKYGIQSVIKALLFFVLGSFMLFMGYSYLALLAVLALSLFLPVAKQLFYYWVPLLRKTACNINKVEMISYGVPLTATFASSYIISFADRLMLDSMLGSYYVGVYSAIYDITFQVMVLVFSTLNLAIYPALIKAFEKEGTVSTISNSSIKVITFITIPLAGAFIMFSSELSYILFGNEYLEQGAKLMPLLGGAVILAGLRTFYFDLAFQLGQKTKVQFYILLFGAVVNIPLNYILISNFGVVGAAYSTLLMSFICLMLSLFIGRGVCRLDLGLQYLVPTSFFVIVISYISSYISSFINPKSGLLTLLVYFLFVVLVLGSIVFKMKKKQSI